MVTVIGSTIRASHCAAARLNAASAAGLAASAGVGLMTMLKTPERFVEIDAADEVPDDPDVEPDSIRLPGPKVPTTWGDKPASCPRASGAVASNVAPASAAAHFRSHLTREIYPTNTTAAPVNPGR